MILLAGLLSLVLSNVASAGYCETSSTYKWQAQIAHSPTSIAVELSVSRVFFLSKFFTEVDHG